MRQTATSSTLSTTRTKTPKVTSRAFTTAPPPDRGIDIPEPPTDLIREGDQLARKELKDRRTKKRAEVARWCKRVAAHDESRTCVADAFTVHLPDRRGRGMSGAFGSAYSIWREDEDLAAMVEHTVADCVRDDAPARRTDSLR